ncbi:MAG: hypothetical protein M5U10_00970 [Candidatus Methanoperedens sp.]|uniref:hypothetical protein n=1 Tax=Candidatus Methanoperedens nitratireducens TaxID=1392998 RepID=UPI0018E378E4|nr:hypothetical protein [Candidatus Methanoperedens nitroreducens]MDJ1420464.1 hypothetical protein [Candidatus Methanoperedens sp.]
MGISERKLILIRGAKGKKDRYTILSDVAGIGIQAKGSVYESSSDIRSKMKEYKQFPIQVKYHNQYSRRLYS